MNPPAVAPCPPFPSAPFDQGGLNRQAIFNLSALPAEMLAALGDIDGYRQLILLGHAGTALWQCVTAAGLAGDNPIDDYSVGYIARCFTEHLPGQRYRIVYPGSPRIGLQQLGQRAGWHHAAPFMLGIDAEWGSWFAYRAVVLTDTHFAPSRPVDRSHPCASCSERPCLAGCPAGALDGGQLALEKCLAYRRQPASRCQYTCLARLSCPLGSEHRYSPEQMRHCYGISLKSIGGYVTRRMSSTKRSESE